MKIKTQDLTGHALDWAVAKAYGYPLHNNPKDERGWQIYRYQYGQGQFRFSSDWSLAGPIIEDAGISICPAYAAPDSWQGAKDDIEIYGPTPLVAAMRCYVASMLGAEVDIHEEITNGN